jgi:hypothetical protein
MASILKVDTLTGKTTATTVTGPDLFKTDELQGKTSAGDITVTSEGGAATMQLQQGLAKAWGSFEQGGTHTFRDSLNFSSITDPGVGKSIFVFSNNMDNADYATTGMSGEQSGGGNRVMGTSGSTVSPATNTFAIGNWELSNHAASDDTRLSVAVLGDLA